MKWVPDYRPGPVEEAFISFAARILGFVLAVFLGLIFGSTVATRGIPDWQMISEPLMVAGLAWVGSLRYLAADFLSILAFIRLLMSESVSEIIGWLVTLAVLWGWVSLAYYLVAWR